MPDSKSFKILIDNESVDVKSIQELPVGISYEAEDAADFQEKASSTAFDITLPVSQKNDRIFNHFRDPRFRDFTSGSKKRNLLPCIINVGGTELLNGLAQLKSGSNEYNINCYGNNGDWALKMKDFSLQDVMNTNTHIYNQATIEASWLHDGTDINKDYVYAPVRYRKPFGSDDNNATIVDMRPSLFVWPMIYRAFNKLGYTIKSNFMSSPFFKRLVMPWVWGDFMNLNSKYSENMRFCGAGTRDGASNDFEDNGGAIGASGSYTGTVRFGVTGHSSYNSEFTMENDYSLPGYDNSNSYEYIKAGTYNGAMVWTYLPQNNIGQITARFSLKLLGRAQAQFNSHASIFAEVYKNGTRILTNTLFTASAGATGDVVDQDLTSGRVWNFSVSGLNVNDNVVVYIRYEWYKTALGSASVRIYSYVNTPSEAYSTFELLGVSIEPGGTVNWQQYDKFRSEKFLDMLRGIIDTFNLLPQTDSISKVVYFEPAFPFAYYGSNIEVNGHYQNLRLDWNRKRDLSEAPEIKLFDDIEQDYIFKHKDDSADGGANKFELRNSVSPGSSMYRFPSRFKTGKKEFENRFFSPVMHYEASPWRSITGVTPQIIALVPENISNTSNDLSETAFQPKLAYYKGVVGGVGGWRFESTDKTDIPYMFAVNYKPGGENDPILSYCDQNINGITGIGLMKRFYLRRLAVMRNGILYTGKFNLKDADVTNWLHREKIIIDGIDYLLIKIDNYRPLSNEPTSCTLWQHWPLEQIDIDSCFPSLQVVHDMPVTVAASDMKYSRQLLITTDLTNG